MLTSWHTLQYCCLLQDVQVLGFYNSPEDYVAGNLMSEEFEYVEEETPFEGDMNKQYNADIVDTEQFSEVGHNHELDDDDDDDGNE